MSHKTLLDRLIYTLRAGNYAIRTEQTYGAWVRRFLTFHSDVNSTDFNDDHARQYLEYLTVNRRVASNIAILLI